MVTHPSLAFVVGRLDHLKLLAALVNPDSQLGEVFERQLLDSLLDFLNLVHSMKLHSDSHGRKKRMPALRHNQEALFSL